ncbi:MAG: hypothetical protein QIT40_gp11 [Lokiarchaeia virus VerdaV4]|uniref:Uncharacterized protein n=1 Tax=Lokiarchaeia virus VerdaV4 TaxID=3070172 RepID=A0AA35CPL2_9CAUD|nr:MAG: hypothetical protein QIT40_gp11 [Lokiarchaeia virus VerdaV4]BDI54969.1 MAG: hypothetical protein [Lokiarchaeia virus VerdaV4]
MQSTWAATWDTTQFNHINITIGTQFNFWITDDSATDITDTAIIDMLKQETHILFGYWNAIIKSSAVEKPWDFIMVWLSENLSGDQFYKQYFKLIKKCREILSGNIRVLSGLWESRDLYFGHERE